MRPEAPIQTLEAHAYCIPTDAPESDGTADWSSTTLVTVHVSAGGEVGFGYTYGDACGVALIHDTLAPEIMGFDALSVEACWNALQRRVRNPGRPGIAATAISAVDNALWDLKAKLLDLSLVSLLGQVRTRAPLYGSGGFTSYSIDRLTHQLHEWAQQGLRGVKMKVGTRPGDDPERVRAARMAIGPDVVLMVDANGAYSAGEALELAREFADVDVRWLEEPVSSDDLEGLHYLRMRVPRGLRIAAGEYGWDPIYYRRMLAAGAVDVLQADATRCLGITGFLATVRLCQAWMIPLSTHCAPSLHAPLACAATPLLHVEYFHDHVRIESALFDGWLEPKDGMLEPDRGRPGLGVELKERDASRWAVA